MSDLVLGLLNYFRYWRSSVPTGFLLALLAVIALLNQWPVLSSPRQWVAPEFWPLASSVSVTAWLVVVLLVSAQLGSWWCGLASGSAVLLGRRSLTLADLSTAPERWGVFQRTWVSLILPLSVVRRLRQQMMSVPDYGDLEEPDRPAAYGNFLRDAVGPHPAARSEQAEGVALLKSWTDLRLSTGLLFPLPLAVWAAPTIVIGPDLDGLRGWAMTISVLVFATLLVESVARLRRVFELSISSHLDPATLAGCARGAVGSGRSAKDVASAEQRTH